MFYEVIIYIASVDVYLIMVLKCLIMYFKVANAFNKEQI